MILEGHVHLDTRGGSYVGKPIFAPSERIIVFDVDDTLLLRKDVYERGQRKSKCKYSLHNQAAQVARQATYDFDRVVLWSATTRIFEFPIFDEVNLRISGGLAKDDVIIKDLHILSPDITKIVAIQDDSEEVTFRPEERVVQINKGNNLLLAYQRARILVNGQGIKTGAAFEKLYSLAAVNNGHGLM